MNLKDQKNLSKVKKHLGQNFLRDKNILNKISSVKTIENKKVIEIGLGQGDLTKCLSAKAKEVFCYEIDQELIENFGKQFSNSNVEIINQDFLKASFDWQEKKVLVANIPYYITSDILFKIFINYKKFSRCVIMLQEEVSNRLVAKVNSKDYGKLTLTTNFFSKNIQKHFVVKPNLFFPPPKVNSAVVSFDLKENLQNVEKTKEFIKTIFAFKRKTIANNLKQFHLQKEQIEFIVKKINEHIKINNLKIKIIDLNARPQNLSLEQVLLLSQHFKTS